MMYTRPILSLILLIPSVFANNVLHPVQQQLPLIARVNQPYSFAVSPRTFSDNSNITATQLPAWITFANDTFFGTPGPDDEGNPTMTLQAGDATDTFSICVTPFPPPVAVIPLADQFNPDNPSLSSVFLLHPGSALRADPSVPALRVPPHWSFSIGFEGGMFAPASPDKSSVSAALGASNLFYAALQADGTPLPAWLTFDPHTVTFNGVTRAPPVYDPDRVSVVLIASDQLGYAALKAPFDIVVASHELSFAGTSQALALYATRGEPLALDLGAEVALLGGAMLDNATLRMTNVTSLTVGTDGYPWLHFDPVSMMLEGSPPAQSQSLALPLSITAVNQTLALTAAVAFSPSYFNVPSAKPVFTEPGSAVTLPLDSYLSNDPAFKDHPINLTATFDPAAASAYLHLSQNTISGTIPSDAPNPHINITITAFDGVTRASSHLAALIELRPSSSNNDPTGALGAARKRRLALGLGIAFGVFGGGIVLFSALALCRRCFAVPDSAVDMYADEKAGGERGYGWSEKVVIDGHAALEQRFGSPALPMLSADAASPRDQLHVRSPYPGVELGGGALAYPAGRMVKKAAFFDGVKATMRQVSGSLSRRNKTKSMIGKPTLMFTKDSAESVHALRGLTNLPNSTIAIDGSCADVDALEVDGVSLGLDSSSSSSTGRTNGSVKSVPTRRPDFGPPRATLSVLPTLQYGHPSQTNPQQHHVRRRSTDTQHSGSSGDVEEAVIVTASRAASVRSAQSSVSRVPSQESAGPGAGAAARPRLVQFTSARGVPVPVPSLPTVYQGAGQQRGERRVSHVARVYDGADADGRDHDAILNEGLRYVNAFGGGASEQGKRASGAATLSPTPSGRSRALTTSTGRLQSPMATQTSYMYPSQSASFDEGLDAGAAAPMSRILVGTGEAFAFKFPVCMARSVGHPPVLQAGQRERVLRAAMLHGRGALPAFLAYAYAPSGSSQGARREEVEFWGTPLAGDIGEVVVGVFDESGECVGRLVVEVVGRGGVEGGS